MRVLGVIPARGGSKGVPRKNVRMLCGKPLIQYTAEAAMKSLRLLRVILSTEDEEIAEVGRRCGLDVPFMRPFELAQDDTPMLPVAQHALRFMEDQGGNFDALCLLQPTNPLRRSEDIDGSIDLLERSEADAVVTILPVPAEYNPHWVYLRDEQGSLRLSTGEAVPIACRQQLPPAFHREGSVYVTRRDVLMKKKSLYGEKMEGYQVDPKQSVNIDLPEHWALAERLLGSNSR